MFKADLPGEELRGFISLLGFIFFFNFILFPGDRRIFSVLWLSLLLCLCTCLVLKTKTKKDLRVKKHFRKFVSWKFPRLHHWLNKYTNKPLLIGEIVLRLGTWFLHKCFPWNYFLMILAGLMGSSFTNPADAIKSKQVPCRYQRIKNCFNIDAFLQLLVIN